jgi:hypothetical protein
MGGPSGPTLDLPTFFLGKIEKSRKRRIKKTREKNHTKTKAKNQISVAPATEASTNIQERDTVTLNLLDGSETSIGVETPNFSAMTETQFHLMMVNARDKANEHAEQHGLAIYKIILPGLEFAKAQFAEGKTVNGCTGIEAYIKSLGLQPATIRKWRERAANRDLLKKINQLTFVPHIGGPVTTPDGNLAKVKVLTADEADVEELLPNAQPEAAISVKSLVS